MALHATTVRMLLIGGGHSHIEVLRRYARRPPPDVAITVVSRDPRTVYSGMVPGLIAGFYQPGDIQIDLAPLCAAAGAELIADTVIELDVATGRAGCAGGRDIRFDYLSLNTGSVPAVPDDGGDTVIAVKPLGRFVTQLDRIPGSPAAGQKRREIAVVGGGAGGVELALALRARFPGDNAAAGAGICIYEAADRLLPGYPQRARQRLRRALRERAIRICTGRRIERVTSHSLITASGESHPADAVLWVTAARAPPWLAASGLALDAEGFVAVNAGLQSVSHANVFAAGDTAAIQGREVPRAGVYAVRQAPVLARNLRRVVAGDVLDRYDPQNRYLSLISTGDGRAVAARGWFVAEGAWVWRWKDAIDRRFVRRYRPENL